MPDDTQGAAPPADLPTSIQNAILAGHSPSDVVNYLAANPNLLPTGSDVAGARAAGYSDQDIINHLSPPPATAGVLGLLDHLVPASVDRGIAQEASGLAGTADIAGAPGLASGIRSHIDPKALNAPTSFGALSSDIGKGHYLAALGDVPGVVGEAIPQIAGTLVSGAAGAALGTAIGPEGSALGAIGGVAAPALLSVAQQAGTIAKARAAASGRATPNDDDIAAAVGSSAVLGALDTVGLGDAAGTLLTRATKTILTHPVASTLAHGASAALQNVGQQVASTAGTTQGLTVDPSQVAAAGIQGVGARVALGGAQAALDKVQSLTPAGRNAALTSRWSSLDPDEQQAVVNTAGAAKAIQDTKAAASGNVSAGVAANTAAGDTATGLRSLGRTLLAQDVLDDDGKRTLGNLIATAASSGKTLTDDHLQQLQDLGIDQPTTDTIAQGLQQLNMLSGAGASGGPGVLSRLGNMAGGAIGLKVGGMMGHPLAGAHIGSTLAGGIGNRLSGILGTSASPLLKAGSSASDMLTAAGVPIPNTRADIQAAVGQQRGALSELDRQLGLSSPGVSPVINAAVTRAGALQGVMPPGIIPGSVNDPQAQAAQTAALSRMQAAGFMTGQAANDSGAAPSQGPNTMTVEPMSDSMASYAARLAPWKYGIGRSVEESLNLAGTPRPLDYGAEANAAVQQALQRGWFDGGAVPAQQRAAALIAHNGRLSGQAYNALRNLMLENYGITRRDPSVIQAVGLPQAAE